MSIQIAGISGSFSKLSKKEIAKQKTLDFTKEQYEEIEIEIVPISEYDFVFYDGRSPDFYIGDTLRIINKIKEFNALFADSPINRGTFSGAFKNLFDLSPNDSLKGKVVETLAYRRLENLAKDTVRLTKRLQTNYAGSANPDIKHVSLHCS
ncbi:MAG: NAD(P)H-dependent oxidoreductase [Balneolaceae bacterium]|nr:NAD(P)H-dependent oxidoreductase [Balneolaceae bacterium]